MKTNNVISLFKTDVKTDVNKNITIKELIEKLSEYDENVEVDFTGFTSFKNGAHVCGLLQKDIYFEDEYTDEDNTLNIMLNFRAIE